MEGRFVNWVGGGGVKRGVDGLVYVLFVVLDERYRRVFIFGFCVAEEGSESEVCEASGEEVWEEGDGDGEMDVGR